MQSCDSKHIYEVKTNNYLKCPICNKPLISLASFKYEYRRNLFYPRRSEGQTKPDQSCPMYHGYADLKTSLPAFNLALAVLHNPTVNSLRNSNLQLNGHEVHRSPLTKQSVDATTQCNLQVEIQTDHSYVNNQLQRDLIGQLQKRLDQQQKQIEQRERQMDNLQEDVNRLKMFVNILLRSRAPPNQQGEPNASSAMSAPLNRSNDQTVNYTHDQVNSSSNSENGNSDTRSWGDDRSTNVSVHSVADNRRIDNGSDNQLFLDRDI